MKNLLKTLAFVFLVLAIGMGCSTDKGDDNGPDSTAPPAIETN